MADDRVTDVRSTQMRTAIRADLERIAEALGLGIGHGRVRLLLEFQDGCLKWWQPSFVRVPPSKLDEGQELGPATAPMSADGEYEWFETIRPAHLPRLIELLGGEAGTDLLDLLAERYTGAGAAELERILRESGIPVEVFVYS